MLGKAVFGLAFRADVSNEERALIDKYKLGGTIVYCSEAFQKNAAMASTMGQGGDPEGTGRRSSGRHEIAGERDAVQSAGDGRRPDPRQTRGDEGSPGTAFGRRADRPGLQQSQGVSALRRKALTDGKSSSRYDRAGSICSTSPSRISLRVFEALRRGAGENSDPWTTECRASGAERQARRRSGLARRIGARSSGYVGHVPTR